MRKTEERGSSKTRSQLCMDISIYFSTLQTQIYKANVFVTVKVTSKLKKKVAIPVATHGSAIAGQATTFIPK